MTERIVRFKVQVSGGGGGGFPSTTVGNQQPVLLSFSEEVPPGFQTIVNEALEKLSLHATLEEELFYPAVRQSIEDEHGVMNEADEEHHVAKILIAELEEMDGSESHYDAKFTVLAENVRHHIKEEEEDMFPKAQTTNIDFEALGEEMRGRKEELLSQGMAATDEADMVAKPVERRAQTTDDADLLLCRRSKFSS